MFFFFFCTPLLRETCKDTICFMRYYGRITHPAPGIPEKLIHDMFYHSQGASREGLGLYISQKLVKLMNGTVQYIREAERSSFLILIEFPLAHQKDADKTK